MWGIQIRSHPCYLQHHHLHYIPDSLPLPKAEDINKRADSPFLWLSARFLLIRLFLDFIDEKDLKNNYIPFLSENFSKINHHALYDFIFGNILKPSQDYINTLFTNTFAVDVHAAGINLNVYILLVVATSDADSILVDVDAAPLILIAAAEVNASGLWSRCVRGNHG